jgi:UDP-3-O-[3-hydroxymyristoyl] glucosamine N-acyltransferase
VIAGPKAAIRKSVPPGETVLGAPAIPRRQFFRIQSVIQRLPDLMKRLKALEKKMSD